MSDDDFVPSASQTREENVASLLQGKRLMIRRARVAPFLSIRQGHGIRRPFKTPCPHLQTDQSGLLLKRRTLGVKRRRTGAKAYKRNVENVDPLGGELPLYDEVVHGDDDEPVVIDAPVDAPVLREFVPLTLWEPPPSELGGDAEDSEAAVAATTTQKPVVVDPILCQWLRAHQRVGLKFIFDCMIGLPALNAAKAKAAAEAAKSASASAAAAAVAPQSALPSAPPSVPPVPPQSASAAPIAAPLRGGGCILADDMGLGKTLQAIALLWTMLKQGAKCGHRVERAIIVTPTSLIFNWQAELKKWLGDRVNAVALMCTTRADVISGIREFLSPRRGHPDVLIISYETFRLHVKQFAGRRDCCDLLILDEAHRLKNGDCLTTRTLNSIPCARRLLLTGTPMQNDLKEFYAMMNFTNHGCVGATPAAFSKLYGRAIIAAQEPDASDSESKKGEKASNALALVVNEFVLRRTNGLLADHLPDRVTLVVCIRPTTLQIALYAHFVAAKLASREQRALPCITILKKVCNHPKLVWDAIAGASSVSAHGLRESASCFPEGFGGGNRRGGARGQRRNQKVDPELSGKFGVLAAMLAQLRATTDDRIVVVSNYVEQLQLIGKHCRAQKYPFVCLDGSTSARKRQEIVTQFNDKHADLMVFLLSAKAGGCGLNLIGGNRLVLYDPDWNPAIDKQVAGRVWRDGQTKRTFIYRFVTTGTIEEKVYQRQLAKEGLQTLVVDQKNAGVAWSTEGLKDIFQLHLDTQSETHDELKCVRCGYVGGHGDHDDHDDHDHDDFIDNEEEEEEEDGDGDFEDSSDPFDSDSTAHDAEKVVAEVKQLLPPPPPSAAIAVEMSATATATATASASASVPVAAAAAATAPAAAGPPAHIQTEDNYDDLSTWGHHATLETVPDPILVAASCGRVSFVFNHITIGGTQRDEEADRAAAKVKIPKKKRLGGGRRRRFKR